MTRILDRRSFAAACYRDNAIHELLASHRPEDADATDCTTWQLSPAAWSQAIDDALIDRLVMAEVPVRHSHKTLDAWFEGDLAGLTVGPSIGASDEQGAEDRWPVYDRGARVGTLYEDANGYSYDARDDDGQPIF